MSLTKPEATALKKFHCPTCGAEAVWHPGKQALVCSYCGTTSPAKVDEKSGAIVEHDLVSALREFGSSRRGWQVEKTSVRCQSCQAISVFDPSASRSAVTSAVHPLSFTSKQAPIHPEACWP
jgi:transcription elongation factor Elf1